MPAIITGVVLVSIAVATTLVVRELGHSNHATPPPSPSDAVATAPGPDNTIKTPPPTPPPDVPSPQRPSKPAPGVDATTSKGLPR